MVEVPEPFGPCEEGNKFPRPERRVKSQAFEEGNKEEQEGGMFKQ